MLWEDERYVYADDVDPTGLQYEDNDEYRPLTDENGSRNGARLRLRKRNGTNATRLWIPLNGQADQSEDAQDQDRNDGTEDPTPKTGG
ncbi:MAG: hypothetical protein R3E95_07530 [Thiolinea sp.]